MEVLELSEHDSSESLDLAEEDIEMLQQEVNSEGEKISLNFQRDGKVILRSKQYVGTVALPKGPVINVRPKAAEGNLVNLLRYARGTDVSIIEQEQEYSQGLDFVDALAQLFSDELERIIKGGLHKEYVRKQDTEEYLRGSLNTHRQIQKQRPEAVKFECDFEELTHDNTTNQAILYSTALLTALVQERSLQSRLNYAKTLLQKQVSLQPVSPIEIQNIELNRLNSEYRDILELCALVVQNSFIRNLEDTGKTNAYSLLFDMNEVYEKVVERGAIEAFNQKEGWKISSQDRTDNLITGRPRINMYPDLVIKREGESVLVADAKWKTGKRPSNSDVYQLVSYELAHETSGILFYPEQGEQMKAEYTVKTGKKLNLVELPTRERSSFEKWEKELGESIKRNVKKLT